MITLYKPRVIHVYMSHISQGWVREAEAPGVIWNEAVSNGIRPPMSNCRSQRTNQCQAAGSTVPVEPEVTRDQQGL